MKKRVFVRFSLLFLKPLVLATVMRFTALAQDSPNDLRGPAAPAPLELPVARGKISFEKVKHPKTGDLYVIQKTQYEDGTVAQTLAAVWLEQPLALEILVLDDFVPTPRLLPTPAAALPERLVVDFDPSWMLDIIATPQYVQSELIFSKPVALAELGACPQGQWRGLARFHAEGFDPILPPKRTNLEIANFVCLRKVP